MNRNQHVIMGALAGASVYFAHRKFMNLQPNLGGTIISAIGGAIGGILPDVLEPPVNPNHRGPCHSIAAGVTLVKGGQQLFASQQVPRELKEGLAPFLAGYVSHLMLDSTTPKSLPLLMR